MSQPHLILLFLNIYKSHKYLLRVCSERIYRLARHMRWNAGCGVQLELRHYNLSLGYVITVIKWSVKFFARDVVY